MITYLKGSVAFVEEQRLVLEVGGIGYQIAVSQRDVERMPDVGEEIKIHTYMSVREDAISLFGFLDEGDLKIFKLLIAVSGIGPKVGLNILSLYSGAQIASAIISDDAKAIGKASGVGPKLAKKVVIELKDRVNFFDALEQVEVVEKHGENEQFNMAKSEAVNILIALGYSKSEAEKAISHANLTEDMDTDQILSAALAERN